MKIDELTLLTENQIIKSKLFHNYGRQSEITDFAILLGGYVENNRYYLSHGYGYCQYWTKTLDYNGNTFCVNAGSDIVFCDVDNRASAIRPVFNIPYIENLKNVVRNKYGILEVEYGEYPQEIVSEELSDILEINYESKKLSKTGKVYTTDSRNLFEYDKDFQPQQHVEYEYEGKKYVRIKANLDDRYSILSNSMIVETGDAVWVEVQPIIWLLEEQQNLAICQKAIASGVRFDKSYEWNGNFENTEMNMFLQTYLKNDIIPSKIKEINEEQQKELKKIREDMTKEFVQFCNQRVITLEDVLNGKVSEKDIKELNTSERYATTFVLTQVSEEDVIKVREFIKRIDPEFVSMFDVLWTHNDESRLEIIAEAKLMNKKRKVLQR